ncbi:MAG TPA: GNAT family N-acetyltransferase [Humidesulfovibrio sp.]|uniref:GNAT family N-acetyltransferase n=1 Tax=Humidesulfovibrio sp. TaxID=2910988 RepID=UPI002BFBF067|nr:GNAT family N-acetyltransferase [Humidesulfovibrio sp.]HWR03941.1 GNAT family N-acetyltransferase [Humidesulfovibrio sp.]
MDQAVCLPGPVAPAEHPELLALWEASVRATHSFLGEADIAELKPLILNQYFDLVELTCLRDAEGGILAFMGTAADRLEMLFVRPDSFRLGLGGRLVRHAVERLGVREVDVNEQNPQALAFYQSLGFRPVGRSDLDGQGRPFPLLTLRLPD